MKITAVVASIAAAAATLALCLPGSSVRTEDRNHDGRPDFWRSFDDRGRVASEAVDSNFDGRSDVLDVYEGGVLVRRESDRDFNDRVDLVQEFDPDTHQLSRSVADSNADGVGDLLVLFQDGRPVFWKTAPPVTAVAHRTAGHQATDGHRAKNDPLVPLADPFSSDLSVKANRLISTGVAFVPSSPIGRIVEPDSPATVLPATAHLLAAGTGARSAALVDAPSPRGPPVLHTNS